MQWGEAFAVSFPPLELRVGVGGSRLATFEHATTPATIVELLCALPTRGDSLDSVRGS